MARIDKLERARQEGMSYALEVARKKRNRRTRRRTSYEGDYRDPDRSQPLCSR